jgi:KAP family P-loop domain
LRTFLEIRPCIFVVAADQQVLEHALTEAARQATPFNPSNPYYSAGSAYLDKIFQYQLALPPILPRRLSAFALELIENREGVWSEVGNRVDLVGVLVPTHVHGA